MMFAPPSARPLTPGDIVWLGTNLVVKARDRGLDINARFHRLMSVGMAVVTSRPSQNKDFTCFDRMSMTIQPFAAVSGFALAKPNLRCPPHLPRPLFRPHSKRVLEHNHWDENNGKNEDHANGPLVYPSA